MKIPSAGQHIINSELVPCQVETGGLALNVEKNIFIWISDLPNFSIVTSQ
ncbi:hypothetical protein RchiOBHm_Chr2g0139221 [Rosa chinensis]|uniref:Uncharacterized protein n=1 Tax=Rosa chinensis TaxID=74649 RepID=A0A2P6RX19_ROSCH|nr:hypothetical protein RchiOBHm_Chr2g0139221 [Rosa chinensis]